MKLKYHILFLLLLASHMLFAADGVHFTATVNKTTVGTSEVFEVTFSINTSGERFAPPGFGGFQVVGGPNESTSMSVINGTVSSSVAYSYDLVAPREGEFMIGPATIMVNGKAYSTAPIKIKVIKGQAPAQNNQAQAGPDNTINTGRSGDISKSLFIRTVVDKSNVYLGQQLTLSYRLYAKVAIIGNELNKLPDLNGFYGEDINPRDQNAHWRIENVNGVRYNVADIKQTVLFPQHAGNITIDPMEMTFIVRQATQSNDPMDQFFGSFEDAKYKITSQSVVVHVKPLPEAGKPADFTGAVGNFSIRASLDKSEVKSNEPLNYNVIVAGSGNLKLLKPVSPTFPPDFEKYDPKITDTITETVNGVSGSRAYNYLVIPRHQGSFTIEPIKFSFFNPALGKYVTLTTKAFPVKVDKGLTEDNVTANTAADKQDIKLLNKDIKYIRTDADDITSKAGGFYGSGLFYFLLLLGPLALSGALVYGKWNDKNNSDIVKVKSRRAGKIAAKHLVSAYQQLQANNSKAFYEAIFKGIYGYLSNKLNISAADLNREKIAAELRLRLVDEGLVSELLGTLDLCEMARYAPVTGISEQHVYDKAKNAINNIENTI